MAGSIQWWCGALIVGMLAGCGGPPVRYPTSSTSSSSAPSTSAPSAQRPAAAFTATADSAGQILQPKSRWVPVAWSELPGLEQDALFEGWNAWIKSCERTSAPFAALCGDVRRLSIATPQEQLDWMRNKLQPHRIETYQGDPNGLLTGYFEPQLDASRVPTATYTVPLYQLPHNLAQRKPWYTRNEIDTLPEAQSALRDRVIAYVADPVDAMVMQIQGSGRLRVTEPNGSVRLIRLAYAGSNDQPYRSLGRWLLDQGQIKDASWPGIKAWLAQNPQRQQELLWSNPRVVFFREEAMTELDASFGPKGAQGVALTPGRSIAVDVGSVPYGAPLWLASSGAQVSLQRLVMAQDTGSAITGAVRADYFAGWGAEAAELAGRLRQPLQLWVLWPK